MNDTNVPLFDYGAGLNETHKDAAIEIAKLAKEHGHTEFAEFILAKFQTIKRNEYDFENESSFIKFLNKHEFKYWIMGWVKDGESPIGMHYPIISITEDIRKLDNAIKE
jgi:hypothetical protein